MTLNDSKPFYLFRRKIENLNKPQKYSRFTRLFLVIMSNILVLTSAGIIFGFSALYSIFISENVFSTLCEKEIPCVAQKERLSLTFTVGASACNLSSLAIGIFLDKHGPRWTMIFGAFTIALGSLGFALISYLVEDLYILSFSLLGIGGQMVMFSVIHLNATFSRHSGLIISCFNGAFQSSSIIFAFFQFFHTTYNVSLRYLFTLYLIVPVSIFLFGFFFMPPQNFSEDMIKNHSRVGTENDQGIYKLQSKNESSNQDLIEEQSPDSVVKKRWTLRMIATSPSIFLLCFLFFFYVLRLNFFSATARDQLVFYLGSSMNLETLYFYALPIGGALGVPLAALLLKKIPLEYCHLINCVIALFYGIITITSIYALHVTGIVTLSLLETIVFSVTNAHIQSKYGIDDFGKINGYRWFFVGLMGFLLQPFVLWANRSDNRFTDVNIFLTVFTFLIGILFFRGRKSMT